MTEIEYHDKLIDLSEEIVQELYKKNPDRIMEMSLPGRYNANYLHNYTEMSLYIMNFTMCGIHLNEDNDRQIEAKYKELFDPVGLARKYKDILCYNEDIDHLFHDHKLNTAVRKGITKALWARA